MKIRPVENIELLRALAAALRAAANTLEESISHAPKGSAYVLRGTCVCGSSFGCTPNTGCTMPGSHLKKL